MMITKTRRKIVIAKLEIDKLERFKPLEIRIPANVKKVTGMLVTASGATNSGSMNFQVNAREDIFYITPVIEPGVEPSDETLMAIDDTQFDSGNAWVTGYVPAIKPIAIDGDAAIIYAWYRAETFDQPFVIRVYVECELAEELEEVKADDIVKDEHDDLEPQEINL